MLAQPSIAHHSENPGEAWLAGMAIGDFEAAWRVNDRVLAARDRAGRDDPGLPYHLRWVWDGRGFDGRDVLVRCYHGLGDTIQFCRYLAPLRARVRSLTLETQPELIPLLSGLPGPDRLIPFREDAPAPPSECDLEIMELAHALRLRPNLEPYLLKPSSPPGLTRGSAVPKDVPGGLIDPRVKPGGDEVKRRNPLSVGICWQAGGWQPARSMPLAALAPLASVPGARLTNLQRGPAMADLLATGAPEVTNPDDTSTDVLGTARLILGLDLVVTVDTMVAHLAGALGVPTWLLLMPEPDWRWRAGGRGSVWYDSVRKYQQSEPGDWAAPVAELARDLTRLIADDSVRGTLRPARGL